MDVEEVVVEVAIVKTMRMRKMKRSGTTPLLSMKMPTREAVVGVMVEAVGEAVITKKCSLIKWRQRIWR
ncbi:hypothetical protein E2562_019780 [Oryza meyeriana var. granulata]|uniref:Uncharacterized protein n=1 Tax=Oryza meyeriana var. granulata TaxID=110450 RepID=A0A6G1DKN0_9ORYZ|nr:hypothetical protein E2562_019780 [Oryza meyeriana var. granulata]